MATIILNSCGDAGEKTRRAAKKNQPNIIWDYTARHTSLREEMLASNAAIRADRRRIEDKVDDNTQRLARLEGIILAREGLVDTIVERPNHNSDCKDPVFAFVDLPQFNTF